MLRVLPWLLTALQAEEAAAVYVSPSASYVQYALKSLFFILFLLAFMFYWYRYLLPRLQSQSGGQSNLAVKERLVVEPGTTLYVLEIKGDYKLLLISNKQTALYSLAGKKLKYAAASKKEFAAYLAEFTKNKDNVSARLKNFFKGQRDVKK